MSTTHMHRPWSIIRADSASWIGDGRHAFVAPEAQGDERDERWPQYGISYDHLPPGVGVCYHRELHDDETFLVLDGTCTLVVEGQQVDVDAGTFIHCPAGTAHLLVGGPDTGCLVVMFGARGHVPDGGMWGEYVPEPHSRALGLGIDELTSDPKVAYAGRPSFGPVEPARRFELDRSPRAASTPVLNARGPWFLQHVDDAEWSDNGRVATVGLGHGANGIGFDQYGCNIFVMRPGEPSCLYHREFEFDEVMLVLDGAGVAVVEGEAHDIQAGDFIDCPAGAAHVFVAAPDRQLVVLMFGTRREMADGEHDGEYVPDPVAAQYGAAVEATTPDPSIAYADWPKSERSTSPPWTWRTR